MSAGVQVADLREGAGEAVDLQAVAGAAQAVLVAEGREGVGLSVAVVDDGRMSELHERYSGIPGPTDVLAFPLEDEVPGPEALLGEVVVSADTAAREAAERGLTFERELLLYVIHGTLHLLGYDDHDPTERTRMHARQEELLGAFLEAQ
jgi:probable rRNA maturation factor